MKKIAIVTGTRAEFGQLNPLVSKFQNCSHIELQLIVTAMHLSPEFGYTVEEIENNGFEITKKIECLLSSDSAAGISKSIGLALIGFADAFSELKPELVVILGDRSEMLAAACAAMIANIPIAHIHGGETTEGAYDESIRHAITKMSFLHFASTEKYRKRIIQLGEDPQRVFNVGALSIDSIKNLKLLSKVQVEESLGFKFGARNILITYHPVTLEENSAEEQFKKILEALQSLKDTKLIFTHANSDKSGRVINAMIGEYVNSNSDKAISIPSMGHLRYLSSLQFIDLVVGNSSSGITEVPYFNIPTVNIGDRQKGRMNSESVINTSNETTDIITAINKSFDKDFRQKVKFQKQLYGEGGTAEKILSIILDLPKIQLKKTFYDIIF